MKKVVLNVDLIYPIGSYYETSDSKFNPNTHFGGTWELENDGAVLVSKNSKIGSKFNASIGTIAGEENHKMTIEELVKHKHKQVGNTVPSGSGYIGIKMSEMSGVNTWNTTEDDGSEYTGEGQPFSIVQPSKIINRWHRIA